MSDTPLDTSKRTWLIASGCAGAAGAAFTADPFEASFQPSERAKAAGAPVEEEGCALEEQGEYGGALYSAAKPLASLIELASLEDDINEEHIKCYRRCMNNPNPPNGAKKGDGQHIKHCREKCHKEYMEKMRKAGLLKEFSAMDAALEWVKNHAKEIVVGSIFVIGGTAYVVSTGGSGLVLTLVVL